MAKEPTKKTLQALLTEAREKATRWERSWDEESAKRRTAEASLKESREHFADLKERLANAESETARLRGYLERVHEDDIVRDGMVEIDDQNGKRLVPKRPPPLRIEQNFTTEFANYGGTQKRTHWTSY